MVKKRKFRQDYVPLDKDYKFNAGDVAIIEKEEIPNVRFKINEKSYLLPYREFIVITKRID